MSAPLYEFLCILSDFPGAQAKRLEVRAEHLANAKSNNAAGIIHYAGAMLESHVAEGQVPSFKGSVIVVRAESTDAARAILASDVYVKSGVWDMDKVQIIPFKTAFVPHI